MIVLGIDTAIGACSAAIVRGGEVLASVSEPMTRGHQERIASMVRDTVQAAGIDFADLDRIGVTVGPGSFTGLRVGIAFAKGLGLALGKPCVGVGVLEALAASNPGPGTTGAVIDAKRGQVYLQLFDRGVSLMAPDALPVEMAAARLAELWSGGPVRLIGPGAHLLAGIAPEIALLDRAAPDPVAVCLLAAGKPATAGARPLYLRAPDAKLPGGVDIAYQE
jgi:tRNA threonylcarbamoyladenosine biosynthesis protein TsaB